MNVLYIDHVFCFEHNENMSIDAIDGRGGVVKPHQTRLA